MSVIPAFAGMTIEPTRKIGGKSMSNRSGPFPWIVLVVLIGLAIRSAMRWIDEWRKNQRDYDNNMEAQLEGLKYKNAQNKQKGKHNDNQS
jgi:Sec-independent protein translocase protein TatA